MPFIKNAIPILEHDTEQEAVIMPNRNGLYSFPERCVFPFLNEDIDNFLLTHKHEIVGEFKSMTKDFPIYKVLHKSEEICLCQAPVGASAAVQFMDYLIGYGVRKIISTGSCGALVHFDENEFLIPTVALRDEGASYHYLPPTRIVAIHTQAIAAIEKTLMEMNIPYKHCMTWTTDGFFRETADMVEYRKAEGCEVVEMECSALVACAEFRAVQFGQILFTADTLAGDEHDERDWGANARKLALKLAVEVVLKL